MFCLFFMQQGKSKFIKLLSVSNHIVDNCEFLKNELSAGFSTKWLDSYLYHTVYRVLLC